MKIAIIYATKNQTTAECAELLGKELSKHTVELFDISTDSPVLSDYDVIVFGYSIRMGKAIKSARQFMKNNAEQLERAKVAYYICCGFIDCFEDYKKRTIPAPLRESAFAVSCLGGSLSPDRFKGFDKFLVKAIRNEILGGGDNADDRKDMTLPTIMEENIAQLADKIKNLK